MNKLPVRAFAPTVNVWYWIFEEKQAWTHRRAKTRLDVTWQRLRLVSLERSTFRSASCSARHGNAVR